MVVVRGTWYDTFAATAIKTADTVDVCSELGFLGFLPIAGLAQLVEHLICNLNDAVSLHTVVHRPVRKTLVI